MVNRNSLKVSVVVPVYKAQQFLSKCVESILNQTYKNIELILVDDESPDDSPIICDNYAEKDARVKVIHKTNEGAAIARKTGIEQASGEFVTFVDSDDWIEPLFIEEMVKTANEHQADAVVAPFLTDDGTSQRFNGIYFAPGYYDKQGLEKEIYPQMLSAAPFFTFGIYAAMWAKLFKTDIAKKQLYIDYKNLTFGEDGCFTYSALLDCDSLFIIDSARYINRVNNTSVTRSHNPKFLNETENLKECLEKIAQEKNWDIGAQLDEYLAYVSWFAVLNILSGDKNVIKQYKKTMKKHVKQYFSKSVIKGKKFLALPLKNKILYYLLVLGCYRLLKFVLEKK